MKFEVEEELVRPVIEAKISAAIVSQLGDTTKLLTNMVGLALSKKVDRDGNVSNYSSDNRFSFVEAVAGSVIREAAKDAIRKIVSEQKPAIQRAVEKHVMDHPELLAAKLVTAFANSIENIYTFKADFTINPKD